MFIGVNLKCAHQVRPPPRAGAAKACLFGHGPKNRCLEELGVIRRVEEAGMMDQNRFESYKAHHPKHRILKRRLELGYRSRSCEAQAQRQQRWDLIAIT